MGGEGWNCGCGQVEADVGEGEGRRIWRTVAGVFILI